MLFLANVRERKLFNLSSFFTKLILPVSYNYKAWNLFFSFATCFSLWHMKSYTACLVGCTRILVDLWYTAYLNYFNVSLYITRCFARSLATFFIIFEKNAFFNILYSYFSRSLHPWLFHYMWRHYSACGLDKALHRSRKASVRVPRLYRHLTVTAWSDCWGLVRSFLRVRSGGVPENHCTVISPICESDWHGTGIVLSLIYLFITTTFIHRYIVIVYNMRSCIAVVPRLLDGNL